MLRESFTQAARICRVEINGIGVRLFFIALIFCALMVTQAFAEASTPQGRDTENKSDKTINSLARVNPSTLAMEMDIPLFAYPGRSGNSVPVSMSYSSKIWRMDQGLTYFYVVQPSGYRQYVTHLNPLYADRSAAGWTTSLGVPTIEEKREVFNQTGRPFNFGGTIEWLEEFYEGLFFTTENEGNGQCSACSYNEGYCPASCPVCNGECHNGCPVGDWWCVPIPSGPAPTPSPDATPTPAPTPTPLPWPTPTPSSTPEPLEPNDSMHYVKRVNVRMGDGSVHEFRKSDAVINCGNSPNPVGPCPADNLGKFLSVDGSGMTLERTTTGSTLFLPNGGKYNFPAASLGPYGEYEALNFTDVNGNKTTFSETLDSEDVPHRITTDTMGRQIENFLPRNRYSQAQVEGTQEINLPGFDGNAITYKATWLHLKPVACTETVTTNCGAKDGALENPEEELHFSTGTLCFGRTYTSPDPNDPYRNIDQYLFMNNGTGLRACNPFTTDGSNNLVGARFNPTVLAEVELPNGQKYGFKYNRYGEISKITYPTGSYEKFKYKVITPLNGFSELAYDQTNRGVYEREVYDSDHNLQQRWQYDAEMTGTWPNNVYKVTTIAPKGDDAMGNGVKTEQFLYTNTRNVHHFGFEDPRVGMPIEEKSYDENGALRSRKFTEITYKGPQSGGHADAKRDPRVTRTISISFEPSPETNALATLSETEYDESGSTDPEYFSHLNVKKVRSYHYAVVTKASVDEEQLSWSTMVGWFSGKLATTAETDYLYATGNGEDYKERGIIGLPIESRILSPSNGVLSKKQQIYDNAPAPNDNSTYPIINAGTSATWIDPESELRGNVTTSRQWIRESNTWLESHARFDNFGNLRKVWDASGDATKYVETIYEHDPGNGKPYHYAYPTKVITPSPATSSIAAGHATTETSSVETSYDQNTGLVLTVKDDFGQITATEYNDPLLRPTKVSGLNFVAPITETEYDDNNRFIRIKKQIDSSNWDEATTYADSFGRTMETVAKDSQGDIIAKTSYDLLGRAHLVTNPYRVGDTVYWTRTRFDEVGRTVESYAPASWANASVADPESNSNLISIGTTSFGISAVTNYVGTFVVTNDASGRKGRAITNALGQILRVDEPTTVGGTTTDADLGSLSSPLQATSYTYDLYGNLVKVSQGLQNRYFKYDSLGRLIRVRQPEQEVNANLTLEDDYNTSDEWTAGFTYDNIGNLLTSTDAKNVTIGNSYDRAGRVVTRAYYGEATPGLTPTVYSFYDGKGIGGEPSPNYNKGKLTLVDNGISQTRYTKFDGFGRLKETEQRTPATPLETTSTATPRVSKYTYNLSGALIEEEYPSGRVVKNELESDGDLMRVYGKANSTAPQRTYASSFSYTALGDVKQMKLGNGRWETAQFNERNQVTQLGLGSSATNMSLWKIDYQYGELESNDSVSTSKNIGNIAKQTITVPGTSFNQTYTYDALNRLTGAKEVTGTNTTPNWTQSFGYDIYGNRTSFSQNIGGMTDNTTPAVNSLTNRFTSSNFSYDENGNITADIDSVTAQARSFVFDGDNKQTEVKDVNGNVIGKYYYDGEGLRVKKVTNLETTIFVYSSKKLIAEYSTLIADSPKTKFLTEDSLGSPRVITDSFGFVDSRRDFLPFGEPLYSGIGARSSSLKYESASDNIRQKFTGYEKDEETSLDFAEMRMYENRFARFTTIDPLTSSGRIENPQTYNRYVYVGNNPISIVDPMGLAWAVRYFTEDGKRMAHFIWYNNSLSQDQIDQGFSPYTYNWWFGSEAAILFGDAPEDFCVMPIAQFEKFFPGRWESTVKNLKPEEMDSWDYETKTVLAETFNFTRPGGFSARRKIKMFGDAFSAGAMRKAAGAGAGVTGTTRSASAAAAEESAATGTSGIKIFRNLGSPEEIIRPEPLKRLFFNGSRYKYIDENGRTYTPRGVYNFIVKEGKIYIASRRNGQSGHINISRGADVEYAGQIRFGARGPRRGWIKEWDNASGHYKPDAASSGQAPLPQGAFKPVQHR